MARSGCKILLMLLIGVVLVAPQAKAQNLTGMTSLATGQALPPSMARDLYVSKVLEEARAQGVPPALADAVATVESGYNALARGTSGEVGLMQILPNTAAMLGFTGSVSELFVPPTNIHYGVAYLARAWAMSGGSVCRALMKYRAGWGQEGFSPLSISYCARASAYLDSQGIVLADADMPDPAPATAAKSDPYAIAVAPALVAQNAAFVTAIRSHVTVPQGRAARRKHS